ncbi:MAG: hypothetical protein ACFFCS_21835 [Candidatus Hodarchaeota archaeon]
MSSKIRCFIVYASKCHVDYIDDILTIISKTLINFDFEPVILGEEIRSTKGYYEEVFSEIQRSRFGIVILDGLRANVTFEFGLLYGLKKPIIVLKSQNAQVNIENLYSKEEKQKYKKKRWFKSILNPRLDIITQFSDYGGRHYCVFSRTLKETDQMSLKHRLEDELEKILSEIQEQTGQKLFDLYTNFPESDKNKVTQVLIGLSLFSYVGWKSRSARDDEFLQNREDFCDIIKLPNKGEVNIIIENLLRLGYVKRAGRYILLNSIEITNEILNDLIENKELYQYFQNIYQLSNKGFLRRFIERLKNYKEKKVVMEIVNSLLDNRILFPDWKAFEDELKTRMFYDLSLISPRGAIYSLNRLFSQVSDEELKVYYQRAFDSAPYYPGFAPAPPELNGRNHILWILAHVIYYDDLFTDAIKFAYRMLKIEGDKWVNTTRDIFREIFYPKTFIQASLKDRISFLENLDYKDEKDVDILLIGLTSATETGSYHLMQLVQIDGDNKEKGAYFTPGREGYEERENYRMDAYSILMTLLDSKNPTIFDNAMTLFNNRLSSILYYFGWSKVKEIWEKAIERDSEYKSGIVKLINNYKKYWEDHISESNMKEMLKFRDQITSKYTPREKFQRLLSYRYDDEDFVVEDYKQYQKSLEQKYEEWAKNFYSDDNLFTEFADLLFSESIIVPGSIGFHYGNLDTEYKKWDLIKGIYLKLKKQKSTGFIYGYLNSIKQRDPSIWESIINECLSIADFFPYYINLLFHHDITDFIIEKALALLMDEKITLKQVWKKIFNLNFEKVSSKNLNKLLHKIVMKKELFIEKKSPELTKLKDFESKQVGIVGLHFLNRILKMHKTIIKDIYQSLVDLAIFLVDSRNNDEIMESWEVLVNLLQEENEKVWVQILDGILKIPGTLLTRTRGSRFIENFIVSCYKSQPDAVIKRLINIFSESSNKFVLRFIFSPKILNTIGIEGIKEIVEQDPKKNLPIITQILQDEIVSADNVPPLLRDLILNYSEDQGLKETIVGNFLYNRARMFLNDPTDPYKRDIELLLKWKENTKYPKVKEMIDFIISKIEAEMKDAKDRHDERIIQ